MTYLEQPFRQDIFCKDDEYIYSWDKNFYLYAAKTIHLTREIQYYF